MSDALAAVATIGAALIGLLSALSLHVLTRIHRLEDELEQARYYNRRLWQYCRHILDLYYRHRRDGSPDPAPIPEED